MHETIAPLPADWLTPAEYAGARLGAADAAMADLVVTVARHRGRIMAETGLSIDGWLTTVHRLLRRTAREVVVAADVLPDLPFVWTRFRDGRLGWDLVRLLCGRVARHDALVRESIDLAIADGWETLTTAHPDAVLDLADRILDEVDAAKLARRERRQELGEFVRLQPMLDGGGSIYGEYGPVNFGILAERIEQARPQPDLAPNPARNDRVRHANQQAVGTANAEGLLTLVSRDVDGDPAKPLVLAHVPLTTLLGLGDAPGQLLTALAGGKLRVSAKAARKLTELPQGFRLQLQVTDDGHPVGVGHTRYRPPQWLRDLVVAAQPTCTMPGCDAPARRCDLDHVTPWDDAQPEQGGRTDVDNLQPLCRKHHRAKTRGDWHAVMSSDGSVVWTHRRTGTTIGQPSLWRIDSLARPALDRLPLRRRP